MTAGANKFLRIYYGQKKNIFLASEITIAHAFYFRPAEYHGLISMFKILHNLLPEIINFIDFYLQA